MCERVGVNVMWSAADTHAVSARLVLATTATQIPRSQLLNTMFSETVATHFCIIIIVLLDKKKQPLTLNPPPVQKVTWNSCCSRS